MKQLTKAILERALAAELTSHLGYEKHGTDGRDSGNSRNGASSKRLKGDFGTIEIDVARDRASSLEPQLMAWKQMDIRQQRAEFAVRLARGEKLKEALKNAEL